MKLTHVTHKMSAAGLGLFVALTGGCDSSTSNTPEWATQATGATAASGGFIAPASGGLLPPTSGGSIAPASGGEFSVTGGTAATGGSTGGSTPPVSDSGEWCEALAVFRDSCQTCHSDPPQAAPMPLVTYEHTQVNGPTSGKPMVEAISERIHSVDRPMPPSSQDPLTAEQLAALDAWIAAGAPSAPDPTCGGEPDPMTDADGFEWPADCEEFHEMTANAAGGPYTVPGDTELYQDFYFDVPWAGADKVQMLAYKPITDNSRVLHHWILYEGISFLAGWAPGGSPGSSPDGVGMYMPTSGQLKMTVHYYNKGNPSPEPDASGVKLCITRTPRDMTSSVFPFIAPSSAPARRRTTNTDTCTVRLTDPNQPVFLLSSSPHMHQLGVAAKLEVIRTDGTVEVLHDRPFDFEDQASYPYDEPVQLNNGDKVRTTCVYQNDTNQSVSFGEGSYDEMCFNFSGYYPACGMTCTASTSLEQIIAGSQGNGCPAGLGGTSGSGSGFFGGLFP